MNPNPVVCKFIKSSWGMFPDDCLKPVRVICSSIYQFKIVKCLLTLTVITYATLLLLELYYFFQTPNMEDLLKYGPLFLQMCYAVFAFVILLLKNHLVENSMDVIELWDISSAGNDVKLRIARESKQVNTFVVMNLGLPLLWCTCVLFTPDSDSQGIFVQHILEKLCPRQGNFWIVIFKMTLYLAAFVMQVHCFQVIYAAQHIKFQMYMLNALIERLGSDVEGFESLVCDEVYQEDIESKLKIIIDRHCDLIRWQNNSMMLMSNLIIPFAIGGIVYGISIVLLFLQEVVLWQSFVMAFGGLSMTISVIAAGQSLEDESENMLLKLGTTNWYNWNTKNKKKLLVILINAAIPIQGKFSENFVINYQLLMFIFKALYSALSILVKLTYDRT